jgi:hypothetical protein
MSTMRKALLVGMLGALVAFALPTPTHATSTTVQVTHYRGSYADAYFSSTDPSGCVVTSVGVYAFSDTGSGPGADLWIYAFDNCNNNLMFAGYGFTSLATGDFQTTRTDSAQLNTTIPLYDYVSGQTVRRSVSLTWSATGQASRSSGNYRYQSPGFTSVSQYSGTFAPAQASGSVSDGTTNYTPVPSTDGSIGSVRNGQVNILH